MNKVASTAIWLALAFGIVLTGWGLFQLPYPRSLPWEPRGLARFWGFLGIVGITLLWASRRWRIDYLLAGTGIAVAIAAVSTTLWPLMVVAWIALSATLLGAFLRALWGDPGGEGGWLINLLLGAGTYGTVVGLLAHFPVNYPGIYVALLMAPILLGWRHIPGLVARVRNARVVARPALDANSFAAWLAVVLGLIHFVVALLPELGFDALLMHLFVPAHLAQRHQWGFDVSYYSWAVNPMLGDWIFALGYMLGGETAARLTNVGFIYLLACLVWRLVSGSKCGSWGAWWAVALFLSMPLTYTESNSLFIDSVWAAFIVAGTLSVLQLGETENAGRTFIAACLLLGFAAAAKAVTLVVLPVLFLILLLGCRRWLDRSAARSVGLGTVLFLLVGLVPYATAWVVTNNPVFPFYNGIFKSPYYPHADFDQPLYRHGIQWDTLYRVTFDSGKYLEATVGASGFHWLLLLPAGLVAILAVRQRWSLELFVAGCLMIVVTFQFQSYLRYIFPAAVLLAAVIGVSLSILSSVSFRLKHAAAGIAMGAVLVNLAFFNAGNWFYRDFPIQLLRSDQARAEYLSTRKPIRTAVGLLNELPGGQLPVAIFGHPLAGGLRADALYPNWYNSSFQARVNAAKSPEDMARAVTDPGGDYVVLDAGWGTPERRRLIEAATVKVVEFGSMSVRVIRPDLRYKAELMKNPTFEAADGWVLGADSKYDRARRVIASSVSSPSYQVVAVNAGRKYLNAVRARCDKGPAQGRVQVNWIGRGSKFLTTDIKVFDCSMDWEEHAVEVIAPRGAVAAVVYASSHTPVPIQFGAVSFRQ